MKWGRTGSTVFGLVLLTGTIASWLVTEEDLRAWFVRYPSQPTLDEMGRFFAAQAWRDTLRYAGPVLLAVLLFARVRAKHTARLVGRVTRDMGRLADRWGKARVVLVMSALAGAPICMAVGLYQVTANIRDYTVHRCPTDVVMIGPAERVLIDNVRALTPPTSRLLLLTRETPWFINYYLYPRAIFCPCDDWVMPKELPPGWLDEKRIDWIVKGDYRQGFRLIPRSEYRP